MLRYKLYTVLFPLSNVLWFDFWGEIRRIVSLYSNYRKKVIRIIIGAKNNDSCKEFFKLLKILPLSAQYIYSVLMFVVNNRKLLWTMQICTK